MTEGRKMTLAEVFARRRAELIAEKEAQDAWEATPEGKAWRQRQDAHHKRMAEADAQWAKDHPQEEEEEAEDDAEAEDE